MPQAIVLAAGLSSRAKTNKLALPIDGEPVLVRLVKVLLNNCSKVIVVTGHYKDEVESMVAHMPNVVTVYNEGYMGGMFTSVQKGVEAVSDDFFLTPGDYPLMNDATIKALINDSGDIRVPVSHGRRGHPIFFEESLIKALLEEPESSNLKVFRDRYKVNYIEVDDYGAISDIDTMEDYHNLKASKH